MNVYDFDDTIYYGDSTLDFYKYCLKKSPKLFLYIPVQIIAFLIYKIGIINKLQFKEKFYGFLKYIKNPNEEVLNFWEVNITKIKPWYFDKQKEDDVIISASPEFLLMPICKQLQIKHLIASKVDISTGECLSENCYGVEKVHRYKEHFGDAFIKEFYSDSITDDPMAKIAQKSYLVKQDTILPWSLPSKFSIKKNFINKEFFLFLIVGVINTINGVIFAFLFSLFVNNTFAFFLGYITSLTISYILNSKFVFNKNLNLNRYWKFCISYIPNFLIQLILVIILLNMFGMHKLIVYTISAAVGVPITFIIVKFFALKNN